LFVFLFIFAILLRWDPLFAWKIVRFIWSSELHLGIRWRYTVGIFKRFSSNYFRLIDMVETTHSRIKTF
jgi:hypothetical protein